MQNNQQFNIVVLEFNASCILLSAVTCTLALETIQKGQMDTGYKVGVLITNLCGRLQP